MSKSAKINNYEALLLAMINQWGAEGNVEVLRNQKVGSDALGQDFVVPFLLLKGDDVALICPLLPNELKESELYHLFLTYFKYLDQNPKVKTLIFIFLGNRWSSIAKTYFSEEFLEYAGKHKKRVKIVLNLEDLLQIESVI